MAKLINKDLDLLRRERRVLRKAIADLDAGEIPMNNRAWEPRYELVCKLLTIVQRHPINADIIKAALEVYSYNDRVAVALLTNIEKDYKVLVKAAKAHARG